MAVLGPRSALAGRRRIWRAPWVDAVVLTRSRLDHYRRRTDRPDRPWLRIGTVTEHARGPGELFRAAGRLFARVSEADGPATYRFTPAGWEPDVAISRRSRRIDAETAPADDLIANSRQPGAVALFIVAGRQRALVDEAGSVFEYQRLSGRWERIACLRLADPEPFGAGTPESVKLAQVSGDVDATPTPWGERLPTLSRSLTTAGIRGTDLGVRIDHAGRTFVLFGDTHWTRPWLSTRDAVAEVTSDGPLPGLPGVRFHGSPLKLVGGRTTMREYDVPLDGFSHGGRLYAFFSSNHFRHGRVMGRSVLARAVEADPLIDPGTRRRPVRFRVLGTFSNRHFINVSVQRRPATAVPGCGADGEVLLIWGSGPYRASEPRLALLDQAALAGLVSGGVEGAAKYWTGSGWTDEEEQAASLFGPAALGELSVRWVQAAGRYLLLSASAPEDSIGPAITLRTAVQPWGPWSQRIRLLDWVATGMSTDPHTRFIRAHAADEVGDRIFRAQARVTGAAYAPYLFDARADGDDLVLRYTLSTWNPYQVVLMQHRLPLADL